MRNFFSILRDGLFASIGVARCFARDQRGVTVIEFAILAPPFFALIGAIFETSLIFLAGQVLDSSIETSGRLIRTGQAAAYTVDNFRTAICNNTFGLFPDCLTNLKVKVKVINSYTAASATPPVYASGQWQPYTSCFNGGVGGDIVMVQAYYNWPVLLTFLNFQTSADGTHLLSAVRVFSNEPFGGTPSGAACT